MNFKSFYQGLPATERKRFADLAGTRVGYIENHLMPRRKIPKPALMSSLAAACAAFGADITQDDLLAFFYRTDSAEQASQVTA